MSPPRWRSRMENGTSLPCTCRTRFNRRLRSSGRRAMENDELVQPAKDDLEKKDQRLVSRRDFLAGLRKWSAAVIGVAVAGAVLLPGEMASGWVNGRGSWVNGHGG